MCNSRSFKINSESFKCAKFGKWLEIQQTNEIKKKKGNCERKEKELSCAYYSGCPNKEHITKRLDDYDGAVITIVRTKFNHECILIYRCLVNTIPCSIVRLTDQTTQIQLIEEEERRMTYSI